jgi:hypothetical protein
MKLFQSCFQSVLRLNHIIGNSLEVACQTFSYLLADCAGFFDFGNNILNFLNRFCGILYFLLKP